MLESLLAVLALTATPPGPPPAVLLPALEEEAQQADPIQAVLDEYDAAYEKTIELWRAASEEERDKVWIDNAPDANEYAVRVLALTKVHTGTDEALTGLLWVAQNGSPELTAQASTAIESDHMGSDRLGPFCGQLEYGDDDSEALLIKILEKSPHEDVRGSACFSLGRFFMNRASNAEAQGASPEDIAANLATAMEFFERVQDEFGDVKYRRYGTLGKGAEQNLYQLQNLQIGMVAPDIAGEDLDGVEFKLSDYRGKVVVLDFWGDW